MLVTADQLLAHAVGDYILQSDWMALEKTKKSIAALAHVLTYMLPFMLITQNLQTLAVISGTHFVIDRWRLARYVVWFKNLIMGGTKPWAECKATGFDPTRPAWLSTWILIIVDNIIHVTINGLAIKFIG